MFQHIPTDSKPSLTARRLASKSIRCDFKTPFPALWFLASQTGFSRRATFILRYLQHRDNISVASVRETVRPVTAVDRRPGWRRIGASFVLDDDAGGFSGVCFPSSIQLLCPRRSVAGNRGPSTARSIGLISSLLLVPHRPSTCSQARATLGEVFISLDPTRTTICLPLCSFNAQQVNFVRSRGRLNPRPRQPVQSTLLPSSHPRAVAGLKRTNISQVLVRHDV
jgi:hypothetical protein